MAAITLDVQGADDVHYLLNPDKVARAGVRAVNRAIGSARTLMVRSIAVDTGLKAGTVRDALPLREASINHPSATLEASLKRIPLIDFQARGPEPSRGKGRGVTYRLTGSRGRIATAFITVMPTSGHRGVFVRGGLTRTPIRELFGPSLGHVFWKYRDDALARAQESFTTNFTHELGWAAREGGSDAAGGSD